LICLLSCKDDKTNQSEELSFYERKEPKSLKDILETKKLKAITTYSGTTYFLYRGRAMGFEYEILKMFAEDLGVELEIKIAKDENKLIEMLNNNEGD
jgi:membrane-bound lytic murein transglycosylase F